MKTACEEAADLLKNVYWLTSRPEIAEERAALAKRLRAEGRKLARYERLILNACKKSNGYIPVLDKEALMREARRIQKARKAK